MADITAKMVAELRASTGLGMMACKKALVEVEGDMEKAVELLRIKSKTKVEQIASRIAAEGVIAHVFENNVAAMVEVNCETDFVAKDESFLAFANAAAKAVAEKNPANLEELANVSTGEQTVEEMRKEIVSKLGENITIRRFQRLESQDTIAPYMHGSKIGVLVEYKGGNEQLGKDVAMHIAASRPNCVSKDQVDPELIEKERHIYAEQAAQSGKPADIVAKMVEGRVNKFLAEVTLLGQPFVKNPDLTIEKLLKEQNASVVSFVCFQVGEGIEKKVVDYAAEVAAASKV